MKEECKTQRKPGKPLGILDMCLYIEGLEGRHMRDGSRSGCRSGPAILAPVIALGAVGESGAQSYMCQNRADSTDT